jgi:hypothetical protein
LNYCKNHETKQNIVNNYNLKNDNDIQISRTSFYEKEKLIPSKCYLDIFNKLYKLHNKYFGSDDEYIKIAVDGTYNNTNKYNIKDYLETSLNLGFFNVSEQIPIELTFEGIEGKNKELSLLSKYIIKNKEKFYKTILILDRAYCSDDFFKLLKEHDIKYVIRIRNNCKNFKNERIVNFIEEQSVNVQNNDIDNHLIDNKKFKSVVL